MQYSTDIDEQLSQFQVVVLCSTASSALPYTIWAASTVVAVMCSVGGRCLSDCLCASCSNVDEDDEVARATLVESGVTGSIRLFFEPLKHEEDDNDMDE